MSTALRTAARSTTRTAASPAPAPALRPSALRTWAEPAGGPHVRGTVVVLVGRGETPEVYERLGRRLAADAYRVVAVGEPDPAPQAVAALLATLPTPHVLVGSDAGALAAVRLARVLDVAGVVLAGLPTAAGVRPLTWSAELDARSACPTHHRVLEQATRTSLFADVTAIVAADLTLLHDAPLPVPVLALHGEADRISPAEHAVPAYRTLGARHVLLVADGRHDVLNDATHRTVAATVVQFLERVRLGADLPALVHDVAGDDRSEVTDPGVIGGVRTSARAAAGTRDPRAVA